MRMKFFELLALLVLFSNLAYAGFEQGYLSPQDIIRALHVKFNKVMISDYEGSCQYMPMVNRGGNRNALGDANPASGDVAVSLPDSSFLSWYEECLSNYLKIATGYNTISGLDQSAKLNDLNERMYGPLLPILRTKFACTNCSLGQNIQTSGVLFKTLPEDLKKQYIANIITWALGSDEEILSYGQVTDMNVFRADLLTYANGLSVTSVTDVNNQLVTVLLKRDEFLQY